MAPPPPPLPLPSPPGAFLMDDLPLVESLVRALATGLKVPVTVKIRRFQSVAKTVEYAQVRRRCCWLVVLVVSCCFAARRRLAGSRSV